MAGTHRKQEGPTVEIALTDEQQAIVDAVKKVTDQFDDEYWSGKEERKEFPHEFHRAMAEGGWLGIPMPEELGGSELGVTEAALMMQTVTRTGAGYSGASAIHLNELTG